MVLVKNVAIVVAVCGFSACVGASGLFTEVGMYGMAVVTGLTSNAFLAVFIVFLLKKDDEEPEIKITTISRD